MHAEMHGLWCDDGESGMVAIIVVEKREYHPDGDALSERAMNLLGKSVETLLRACEDGLGVVVEWMDGVPRDRFFFWWRKEKKKSGVKWEIALDKVMEVRERLEVGLDEFVEKTRFVYCLSLLSLLLLMRSDDFICLLVLVRFVSFSKFLALIVACYFRFELPLKHLTAYLLLLTVRDIK